MVAPPRGWDNPDDMLGVDEALDRILDHFQPLESISIPLLDALGMVLAEGIAATVNVPPFRNSAMDGYALRSDDTATASVTTPARFVIAETIAAGSMPRLVVGRGHAVRIMTGAPLPAGADSVVRFEEAVERDGAVVEIQRPIRRSENVREAGEDIRAGQTVFASGTPLQPAAIGVLASLNRATVLVHRRPRVAILATGDEVIDLGPDLQPGQVRNSNSYTLAAMVHRYGGSVTMLGVAGDTASDLLAKLRSDSTPDLLVTSGGVSVGDYDVVKDVFKAEGRIDIWQVRMKPGKPLAFGLLNDIPLLGLPGNPVAALVSFEQFGRPALRRMLGYRDARLPEIDATLTEPIDNPGRRRHFVRGVIEVTESGIVARPTGKQGSGVLSSMLRANCFIIIPETCTRAEAGQRVRVQPFEDAPFSG